MQPDQSLTSLLVSMPLFLGLGATFLAFFTAIIVDTTPQAILKRTVGVFMLAALTYMMESAIVPLCTTRPHWAAIAASLLWVQFFSASEILLVSRVHSGQLSSPGHSLAAQARAAVGLLWNMRRIGTQWQVKNVPSASGLINQSRASFVLRRLAVTAAAYLFIDVIVSLPPPPPPMVHPDKAALFLPQRLGIDDLVFRTIMTGSYWVTTGILNLFMTNVGAMFVVLAGLSRPVDCPPLYGSFSDAYTVRRFWGVSWHQMFRSFLTGHANLIVDAFLPFPHHSTESRYIRQAIAFAISGLLHYHADQLMGVSDTENGALMFFILHHFVIVVEDAVGPVLSPILPRRLLHALGYVWVAACFVWSTPQWMYAGNRLGIDSAALLPVRIFGPYIEKFF